MAVREVPCLNSDRDFKVADSGFALTQVYKIDLSLNWKNQTRIWVFLVSTKEKGPSQNNTSLCFTLYPLTHEFLSLLWCYLNHFSDVTGTNIPRLDVERFDWLHQFLVIRYNSAYVKHARPFHLCEGVGAARLSGSLRMDKNIGR